MRHSHSVLHPPPGSCHDLYSATSLHPTPDPAVPLNFYPDSSPLSAQPSPPPQFPLESAAPCNTQLFPIPVFPQHPDAPSIIPSCVPNSAPRTSCQHRYSAIPYPPCPPHSAAFSVILNCSLSPFPPDSAATTVILSFFLPTLSHPRCFSKPPPPKLSYPYCFT